MSFFEEYIKEIAKRKKEGLKPKPIDNSDLIKEIIDNIKDITNNNRNKSLNFFIYNILPGTTSAAKYKAKFLKDIITKKEIIEEINIDFAFELLSHMKGGPSIKFLIDLALGNNITIAKKAANILKTQVFLYDADTDRLKKAYSNNNEIAIDIINSYAKAEFFTKLPEIEEEIKVVTYVAGIGDISTDLLSP